MKRWISIVALTLLLFPFSACNTDISSSGYSSENEAEVCTVLFDTDGGTSVESQTVQRGGKIVKPDDPSKLPDSKYEYVFAGWYLNETEWNFETNTVSESITLIAKWDVEIYTPPFTPSD